MMFIFRDKWAARTLKNLVFLNVAARMCPELLLQKKKMKCKKYNYQAIKQKEQSKLKIQKTKL